MVEGKQQVNVVRKGDEVILEVASTTMEELAGASDAAKDAWFLHQVEQAGFKRVRTAPAGAMREAAMRAHGVMAPPDMWSKTVVRNARGDVLAMGEAFVDLQFALRPTYRALLEDGVAVLTLAATQGEAGTSERRSVFDAVVESFAREWIRERSTAVEYGFDDDSAEAMVAYVNAWVAEPLHAVDVLAYTSHWGERRGDGTFEDEKTVEHRLEFMARWCLYEDVRAKATELARAEGLIGPRDQWEYRDAKRKGA